MTSQTDIAPDLRSPTPNGTTLTRRLGVGTNAIVRPGAAPCRGFSHIVGITFRWSLPVFDGDELR